jgi:hypothetical protein
MFDKVSTLFNGNPTSINQTLTGQGFEKRKGVGVTQNQPLTVMGGVKKPVLPVFLEINTTDYKVDLKGVDNASSIVLQRVVITGLPVSGGAPDQPSVLALRFKGNNMSNALQTRTIHNYGNIPEDVLMLYYNKNTGIIDVNFHGNPIVIWQKRSANSFREIGIELIDPTTGASVAFTTAWFWLFVETLDWQ